MSITIFTPTYNRAHLLERLYRSIAAQSFSDMEWLIVDDGSSDDTAAVVQGFIDEGKVDIRYIRQENGGKHRAINRGAREARGELFFIADSDDALPSDALTTIDHYWQQVRDDATMGGVCGMDARFNGRRIGTGLPQETIDSTTLEIRLKYGVTGDMKEVYRTSIMREFPFPEIEGERFCPEALVLNRIAQKYRLRFINKSIYLVEYQPTGLTSRIVAIRMDSPVATCTHYCELNGYDIPLKEKAKAAINYWRFRACVPRGKQVPKLPWYWSVVGWLAGIAMHRRDVKNRKNHSK